LARSPHRTARRRRPLAARIAALAALAAFGCASAPEPKTTVLAKVPERIVILPMNVTTALPAELKGESTAVWSSLEVYLRAHGAGLKTLAYPSAHALWLASIRDAKADPKLKNPGFDDAARLFVAKLKQHTDFDALVIPSLYVQRAVLSGTTARWDGAEQTIDMVGRADVQIPSDAPIEGVVPAASLHAVVFDGEGARLHEGRAGLALLMRARLAHTGAPNEAPTFTFVARNDPFDHALLVRGAAKALAPWVPALPAATLDELATHVVSGPPAATGESERAPEAPDAP
jgi:hypothetical protein